MITYISQLSKGKTILWCYLIWYGITLCYYFDPSPQIWLNSIGISVVIGIALLLSVSRSGAAAKDYWQTARLFMMPFCVSSFSSLIKGKGFLLILPPQQSEQIASFGACLVFISIVGLVKWSA